MDRNFDYAHPGCEIVSSLSARRAWIEILLRGYDTWIDGSLSARRAWIEISMLCSAEKCLAVALRKESVDRNLSMGLDGRFKLWSLSARRAWIEIWMASGA